MGKTGVMDMSALSDFSADCSRCFALCCVALSFQRSADFGHDKPSGTPCHHLGQDFRCRIHTRREALGYEGCEEFDCLGAGQLASAEFSSRNWRREPSEARLLHARFLELTRIQEMRRALHEALDLSPAADIADQLKASARYLEALAGPSASRTSTEVTIALSAAETLLQGLADELDA
jgi:hypothetical protein